MQKKKNRIIPSIIVFSILVSIIYLFVTVKQPYVECSKSTINDLGITINLDKKALIKRAHRRNIAVQYWTINDADDVEYLTKNGADCIMSDYPDMASEVVASLK